MKFKKFLAPLLAVAIITVLVIPFPSAQTRVKSYYSGDAVSYNGRTVIATTDTGELELFTITDSNIIQRFAALRSYDNRFNKPVDFKDVLLNIEQGSLYAYAVDGRSLIKYDISDLQVAREVAKVQDNSWDWFGGIEKIHDYVATIGTNGIKLWTANMQVFDQYKVVTPGNYIFNSSDAGSKRYVFTVGDKKIRIFDRESRSTFQEIPLDFTWAGEFYKRAIYNDRSNQTVFVVDDEAVRKINFQGEIIKSFDHTGTQGYDIVPSNDGAHLYFSDGIGIVKLRKSDLAVVDFVYTQNFGTNGWAMGLKVVADAQGERLIVFNSSGIIVLNSNLEPLKTNSHQLAIATTDVIDSFPPVTEPVYLKIDRNRAAAGSTVILSGGGFGRLEPLKIEFRDQTITILANEQGMFVTTLTVPTGKQQQGTDIKVTGEVTHISYNLGFYIE